jgi:tetraacyldisaccharide 4'-kinase
MGRYSKTTESLFIAGGIFSPLYSLIMRVRAALYRYGIFKQHQLSVPVISVGNIILGGTGKTPLVQHIAGILLRHGHNPAILSRGYGGRAREQINVVADGKDILLSALDAGDEPRLLAENLPGAVVITGVRRSITANHAVRHLGADVIVLDDGFQHLSIHRNLDLVLFNADTLLSTRRVLPGGDLREPLTALKRANGFVITDLTPGNTSDVDSFKRQLSSSYPGIPIFTAQFRPRPSLKKTDTQGISRIAFDEAKSLALYGFCGIANPDSFRQLLSKEKFTLNDFKAFRDHHHYTERDIKTLCQRALQEHATALITTNKDFVKLQPLLPADLPILVLDVEIIMNSAFDDFLMQHINRPPTTR